MGTRCCGRRDEASSGGFCRVGRRQDLVSAPFREDPAMPASQVSLARKASMPYCAFLSRLGSTP